ncbi:hypothetical protein FWK35_00009548, partial [Aphis craccivora]
SERSDECIDFTMIYLKISPVI